MQSLHRKCVDSQPESRQAAQTESAGRQLHERPGVLVVDDEHFVRIMVQLGLERNGFEAWLAANGREAIQLYRMHRDRIAVVLLDVRMPGLDGPRTLEALRELNPAVQACFMSGDPGAYESNELLQRGAACVIAKPFDLNELAKVLQRLTPGIPPIDEERAAESSTRKETEEVARHF
jgi:CheY-like chemotaxis protein